MELLIYSMIMVGLGLYVCLKADVIMEKIRGAMK